MAVIHVDPEQLAAQAQAALQEQQQVLALIDDLQRRMNELQGSWAGDAAEAAQGRFSAAIAVSARQALDEYCAAYAQTCRDLAARFAEADTPRAR